MLYEYFTEKFLGQQDIDVEPIEEIDNLYPSLLPFKTNPQ